MFLVYIDSMTDEKEIKKPVENEENCDSLTMNCHEMPKIMESLIRKEQTLTEGIMKIDELKKMFPSRKELVMLQEDALLAKQKIHGTIGDITTRFSMCTLKEEKPVESEDSGLDEILVEETTPDDETPNV
jgi:hypothetical protein